MTNPKDLINWRTLSRYLAGNNTSVSKNRIPLKYQKQVEELIEMIDGWQRIDVIQCPVCDSKRIYKTAAIHCDLCAVTSEI